MKIHKNNETAIQFLSITALLLVCGMVTAGINIAKNHRIAEKIENKIDNAIPVGVVIYRK